MIIVHGNIYLGLLKNPLPRNYPDLLLYISKNCIYTVFRYEAFIQVNRLKVEGFSGEEMYGPVYFILRPSAVSLQPST
jgi:hypothetical protein